MKVKIYVIRESYDVSDEHPRILTEKQYQEKLQEQIKYRMENLNIDDGFEEHLAEDYHINQVFFLTEEEKAKIIKSFEPYAIDSEKDYLKSYYDECIIEI